MFGISVSLVGFRGFGISVGIGGFRGLGSQGVEGPFSVSSARRQGSFKGTFKNGSPRGVL